MTTVTQVNIDGMSIERTDPHHIIVISIIVKDRPVFDWEVGIFTENMWNETFYEKNYPKGNVGVYGRVMHMLYAESVEWEETDLGNKDGFFILPTE